MTPRPYQQTQRQTRTDQTEARILKAARELLFSPRAGVIFSLEAVAKRAKVTRRTIYLRFGSRRELIEAAFDAMAAKSGMQWISSVFQIDDPMEALMQTVISFCQFYEQGRSGMRRVRAHAEFDPELGEAIRERNERRRGIFRMLIERLATSTGSPTPARIQETVDLVFAVTGFETWDSMVAGDETEKARTALQGLVRRIVST